MKNFSLNESNGSRNLIENNSIVPLISEINLYLQNLHYESRLRKEKLLKIKIESFNFRTFTVREIRTR